MLRGYGRGLLREASANVLHDSAKGRRVEASYNPPSSVNVQKTSRVNAGLLSFGRFRSMET
jgi:hypothetical protein